MRHFVFATAMGALTLLRPHGSIPAPLAPQGLRSPHPVIYAVDNPAEPGAAFPNDSWSGGTD
ncbi:MAG TPA: hypothetical protein VFE37_19545 [Chloroflexota bacterium]|nr:hypothetical protein [Chloroflexota bacterium]